MASCSGCSQSLLHQLSRKMKQHKGQAATQHNSSDKAQHSMCLLCWMQAAKPYIAGNTQHCLPHNAGNTTTQFITCCCSVWLTCHQLEHDQPHAPHVCCRLCNEAAAALHGCLRHLRGAVVACVDLQGRDRTHTAIQGSPVLQLLCVLLLLAVQNSGVLRLLALLKRGDPCMHFIRTESYCIHNHNMLLARHAPLLCCCERERERG